MLKYTITYFWSFYKPVQIFHTIKYNVKMLLSLKFEKLVRTKNTCVFSIEQRKGSHIGGVRTFLPARLSRLVQSEA